MMGNQEDLNKLKLVQNVACRTLLLAYKYEHIDEMHQELKLEKLKIRRKFHLGNLCHKNVHCIANTGIQDLFIKRDMGNHTTTRTAACNVVVPLVRTATGCKAICYRGPSFWNGLSKDFKIIDKYPAFVREWRKVCCTNFEKHPT